MIVQHDSIACRTEAVRLLYPHCPVTVCWKAIHCLAGLVGLNARHGLKSSLWVTIPLQGTRLRHQHASQAGPPHPAGLITFFFAWCFTSTETVRTIRDGQPRTATSTFTQLLALCDHLLSWCFTSTAYLGLLSLHCHH